MDEQSERELRSLRARAYGPDADLGGDPDALRRLDELESAALAERAVQQAELTVSETPPTVERPGSGRIRPEWAGLQPESGSIQPESGIIRPESDSSVVVGDAPPRLWWTRRRLTVLAAFSLVAVIVVVAAITAAFTYRLQADPRQVAVLPVDSAAEWPEIFGGRSDGGQIFAEFYGLRALTQRSAVGFSAVDVCISVVEASVLEDGASSFRNFYLSGCGAGEFPAVAPFIVNPSAPDALRERFPDGTALQFVLGDDEVVVFSSPPRLTPEETPNEAG
ncbi:hypothetical protein ACFXQA_02205 [Microbacterium sp. P07]|uniref:hypothetical protein n=1 Tax=Microbacterium sp. P07 TaxID=3366952 RepID=UPI0037474DFD